MAKSKVDQLLNAIEAKAEAKELSPSHVPAAAAKVLTPSTSPSSSSLSALVGRGAPVAPCENGDALAALWSPSANTTAERKTVEDLLLSRGLVETEKLLQAKSVQANSRGRQITHILLEMGAVKEEDVQRCLAEVMQLPFEQIDIKSIDHRTFELLGLEFMKTRGCCGIRRDENHNFVLGMVDPADVFLIDEIKRKINIKMPIIVVVCQSHINAAIEAFTNLNNGAGEGEDLNDIIQDVGEEELEVVHEDKDDTADLAKASGESPVIRLVNYIIFEAVKQGASDIHIEPRDKRLVVRYRIDGVLYEAMNPPYQMQAACTSRLKIMANLDIAERRLPQDGRIKTMISGRQVDLRVSTVPTQFGEKTVIRILDNRSTMVGLEKLGFSEDMFTIIRNQIDRPNGVILVTGPTGSGKTTTLYSALRCLDGSKMNISTVEDPIEYKLEFATQIQIREKIGMTFAAALRALMRQDPDVIMLGEIRDGETAHIAVQASLTGHLVLSTLHTNDAPSSITRLINIGVEPYLISAAVNAVLAQRLVRRICQDCKELFKTDDEGMNEFLITHGFDPDKIYKGKGCQRCRNTGYKGRIGVYELLVLDDVARDLVVRNPNVTELRRICKERGMVSLREDGLQKVAAGLTTIEEVLSATENTV
ncbi:MAG: Flp pilus assembly complex ATPase component TadA [Phycisphaerales bacterium]|nr:Flp pilus assembly complex ATPase component TadA [Phycisphaerales bacterium]